MTHHVAQADAHPQGDFGGIVNLVLVRMFTATKGCPNDMLRILTFRKESHPERAKDKRRLIFSHRQGARGDLIRHPWGTSPKSTFAKGDFTSWNYLRISCKGM